MRNFLSRYKFRYPEIIVYMIQASEYSVRDFLRWYHRVDNFSEVQKRGKLEKTTKARILMLSAWFILYLIYIDAIFVLFSDFVIMKYLVFILEIVIAPYLLPYIILIPLLILNFLQKGVQYKITQKAKEKIKNHKGYKIAIAGSYGKTTMREILYSILSTGKKVAKAEHNYNTVLGLSKFIDALEGNEDVVIFEYGEYMPGDINKMFDLTMPDMAIITGVNEAHLEKFGSTDKTVKEIFTLAEKIGDKPVYVNAENDLAKNNAPKNSIFYNQQSCGDISSRDAFAEINGTTFTMIYKDKPMPIFTSLLGVHQIGPILAASNIAIKLGLSIEQIKTGIESIKPFPHRLEPQRWKNGVTVLDDSYNGNPDGVTAVIKFLSSLSDHRRFYVTPGLVETADKTEEIHKKIGKQLADAGIERVILIKNSVTKYIEQGLKDNAYKGEIIWFDSMPEVLESLPHTTLDGDVVLIQNDWPDQYQ